MLSRPSLQDLYDRIFADFDGVDEAAPSLVKLFAAVLSGLFHSLYGLVVQFAPNTIPPLSKGQYLVDWLSFYGLVPNEGAPATGQITLTLNDAASFDERTIVFVRDDGIRYTNTAGGTYAGPGIGVLVLPFVAVSVGAETNLSNTETSRLVLETPIPLLLNFSIVGPDGFIGGLDRESEQQRQDRLALRLSGADGTGRPIDYDLWARDVVGVTRVFVRRNGRGDGTVLVFPIFDGQSPIFPTAGQITLVEDAIDANPVTGEQRRPVTADVRVEAAVDLPVNFVFSALVPDTQANRDAIEAELKDLFARLAEPGDGLGKGTISLKDINTTIGVAHGVGSIPGRDYTLTSPAADIVPADSELPSQGTVTWPS